MPATALQSRSAMLIGKFATLTGRSAYTIRWYESQRLIPGVRRDAQGRRLYVAAHVEWLALLERLRRSGMTIREIREYANIAKRGESTREQCRQLLRQHRKRIEASIDDLQQSLALIDSKIDFYSKWLSCGTRPEPLDRTLRASKRTGVRNAD